MIKKINPNLFLINMVCFCLLILLIGYNWLMIDVSLSISIFGMGEYILMKTSYACVMFIKSKIFNFVVLMASCFMMWYLLNVMIYLRNKQKISQNFNNNIWGFTLILIIINLFITIIIGQNSSININKYIYGNFDHDEIKYALLSSYKIMCIILIILIIEHTVTILLYIKEIISVKQLLILIGCTIFSCMPIIIFIYPSYGIS